MANKIQIWRPTSNPYKITRARLRYEKDAIIYTAVWLLPMGEHRYQFHIEAWGNDHADLGRIVDHALATCWWDVEHRNADFSRMEYRLYYSDYIQKELASASPNELMAVPL